MQKIQKRNFANFETWQDTRKLAVLVYQFSQYIPQGAFSTLSRGMHYSVLALLSRIADGYCAQNVRKQQICYTSALASLIELQNAILLARDITEAEDDYKQIAQISISIHKQLDCLLSSTVLWRQHLERSAQTIIERGSSYDASRAKPVTELALV